MEQTNEPDREELRRSPRYGDYPELFWDLQPDAPIDLTRPSILARILREGSLTTIIALVPPSLLRERLPDLTIPEHTRRFWNDVLEGLDRATGSDSRA